MQAKLKNQIDSISEKVSKAEKMAEKQIRQALKNTENFRSQQLKNIQQLIKQARTLKDSNIAKRADQVRKDLETKASEGLNLLLARINVPTKKEIERLSKKVASLQKRLDEVEKTKSS
jgi:hypothetical protein